MRIATKVVITPTTPTHLKRDKAEGRFIRPFFLSALASDVGCTMYTFEGVRNQYIQHQALLLRSTLHNEEAILYQLYLVLE